LDEYVTVRIKRDHLGQIADGLEVLLEQWEATRAYWAEGISPEDGFIRECNDLDEAEWACGYYKEILKAVWKLLEATRQGGRG
jgi:hypothetical protein